MSTHTGLTTLHSLPTCSSLLHIAKRPWCVLKTIDDGCRRYHVDRSHLRLLSTYRGPGTEWLTNEQVDRDNLRSGAPNEDIVRYGQPYRMAPFWVGLFKGSLYPNMADSGLVHRSPPIDGTGQFRVRFCLDC